MKRFVVTGFAHKQGGQYRHVPLKLVQFFARKKVQDAERTAADISFPMSQTTILVPPPNQLHTDHACLFGKFKGGGWWYPFRKLRKSTFKRVQMGGSSKR